jgi:Glycosyltransferase family 87
MLTRAILLVFIIAGLYGLVRLKREVLVDFEVPQRAAARFLAHEPLYRPSDGHYQFKYLPTFAAVMVPFALIPKRAGEITWFALTVVMTWGLVRLAITNIPDRRLSLRVLFWLTLLFNGKSLVKELAFGQFNLPVALLLLGAVILARDGRGLMAGAAVAAAVFVKPYALILLPWLAWTVGWRAVAVFGLVLAAGLSVPIASYGWDGNLTQLAEWYRTVTETTAPNLLGADNVSFASMWAKWLGPGEAASRLALASTVTAVAAGFAVIAWRKRVAEPNYLEGAYFLFLIALVSPQGWDYVLLIGLPAYVCLIDRWRDLTLPWRGIAAIGIILTSFMIYDVLRRTLYLYLLERSAVSVGAVRIAAVLVRMRWRALA